MAKGEMVEMRCKIHGTWLHSRDEETYCQECENLPLAFGEHMKAVPFTPKGEEMRGERVHISIERYQQLLMAESELFDIKARQVTREELES